MKPAGLSVGRDDGVTRVRDMFSMIDMSKGMALVNDDQVLVGRRPIRNVHQLPQEKKSNKTDRS